VTKLTYGKGISCELDTGRVTHLRAAPSDALAVPEIIAELRTVLAKPLDYPPLADATVPGDHAVIALSHGVPCPLAAVEGAFLALNDAGIESELISVLVPPGFSQEVALQDKLTILHAKGLHAKGCLLTVHDPDDEKSMAMLGVTRDGQPIRLNRQLCDADVVLSVGASSEDNGSSFNGLFPGFSDRKTINRLEAPLAEDDQSLREQSRNEIVESGWLLCLGMVVQVIPGPGATVARILAGEAKKVSAESEKIYRALWSCPGTDKADLVIATLVGNASEQTWHNLGRALRSARRLLNESGSIAICSEIDALPGKSFRALVDNEDYDIALREIMREKNPDSLAAWQVCRALEQGSVYLCSRLPDAFVESLGMTPIALDQELERLTESHDHTILLEEAQHLLPVAADL